MDSFLYDPTHQSTIGIICTSIHGVYTRSIDTRDLPLEEFIISRCLDAEDYNKCLVL
jgi:hypothetical protein